MLMSRRVGQALILIGILSLPPILFFSCGREGGSPAPTSSVFPRFAYVVNFYNNTVSIYTVDAATGQLRHNG
jgi:hypothetical protein